MDIAAYSIMSSQMKMMSQVSVAVTKLAMNTATDQAQEMTKVLEKSMEPGKGASLDISV